MRGALLLLSMVAAAWMSARAGDGEDWRDGRRVLLVRASSPDDARLRQQEAALSADPEGLALRDVLVVRWVGDGNPEVSLPDGKAVPADVIAGLSPGLRTAEWRVLLIGRDGEVKVVWEAAVPLAEVFARIDAMPMGRREKEAREADARP
jgi:hypothetical protein